ncbi:MAG: hypothetical protein ACT4P0_07015 [Panacagrimonas sp.]
MKVITSTLTPGPAGTTLIACNLEGSATGFGFTAGTLTACSAGQKAGTWSWCAATYPQDGESVTGRGEGTFRTAGANQWHMPGIVRISDGRSCRLEGMFDMAARSWVGRIFEHA